MPLARYMLQTWRIEHQRRLLHTSPPVEELVRDSDGLAEALLGEINPDPARPALGLASLLRARELLNRTRLGPQGLTWTTTRPAQLARTVNAAADNAQLYSPRCRHRGPGESLTAFHAAAAASAAATRESTHQYGSRPGMARRNATIGSDRVVSPEVTAPAAGAVAVVAGGWALFRHCSRTRPMNGGLVRARLGRPR